MMKTLLLLLVSFSAAYGQDSTISPDVSKVSYANKEATIELPYAHHVSIQPVTFGNKEGVYVVQLSTYTDNNGGGARVNYRIITESGESVYESSIAITGTRLAYVQKLCPLSQCIPYFYYLIINNCELNLKVQ